MRVPRAFSSFTSSKTTSESEGLGYFKARVEQNVKHFSTVFFIGVSRPYRLLPRRRFRNITASANAINERYFGNNVYDPLARPVADDSKVRPKRTVLVSNTSVKLVKPW